MCASYPLVQVVSSCKSWLVRHSSPRRKQRCCFSGSSDAMRSGMEDARRKGGHICGSTAFSCSACSTGRCCGQFQRVSAAAHLKPIIEPGEQRNNSPCPHAYPRMGERREPWRSSEILTTTNFEREDCFPRRAASPAACAHALPGTQWRAGPWQPAGGWFGESSELAQRRGVPARWPSWGLHTGGGGARASRGPRINGVRHGVGSAQGSSGSEARASRPTLAVAPERSHHCGLSRHRCCVRVAQQVSAQHPPSGMPHAARHVFDARGSCPPAPSVSTACCGYHGGSAPEDAAGASGHAGAMSGGRRDLYGALCRRDTWFRGTVLERAGMSVPRMARVNIFTRRAYPLLQSLAPSTCAVHVLRRVVAAVSGPSPVLTPPDMRSPSGFAGRASPRGERSAGEVGGGVLRACDERLGSSSVIVGCGWVPGIGGGWAVGQLAAGSTGARSSGPAKWHGPAATGGIVGRRVAAGVDVAATQRSRLRPTLAAATTCNLWSGAPFGCGHSLPSRADTATSIEGEHFCVSVLGCPQCGTKLVRKLFGPHWRSGLGFEVKIVSVGAANCWKLVLRLSSRSRRPHRTSHVSASSRHTVPMARRVVRRALSSGHRARTTLGEISSLRALGHTRATPRTTFEEPAD